MRHAFTPKIMEVLEGDFGDLAQEVFDKSPLLQYLNIKTKSAERDSKSRSSFGNLYALYILAEDYVRKGYATSHSYKEYEGAKFTDLMSRQRELPFGGKLQNHPLNSRLNEEFRKYFMALNATPVIRDLETTRYWINESLIVIPISERRTVNLAASVLKIIDAYVEAKRAHFDAFIETCRTIQSLQASEPDEALEFVQSLLRPNVDARLFEIVSFAILKYYYCAQSLFWGWTADNLHEDPLILYKTGRANANDGGIDFVMRPLGRFFQVTETLDTSKYFLDIDKVQRFPLTFVVKSEEEAVDIWQKIKAQAETQYPVKAIVDVYMNCIEEIINLSELTNRFNQCVEQGSLPQVMSEIILQSRVEFNYDEESEDD